MGEQTQSHFGDSSFTYLTCTCRSVTKVCLIVCNPMDYSMPVSLSSTVSQSLLKFMSIESVMLSNHLIFHCPLLFLPSVFPASGSFPMIWLFASGAQRIGASASASVLPVNIQSWFPLGLTGLIYLLSMGTLQNLLQHHNLKASILWHSAFFMVQLSHPYMTIGKNHSFD